MPGPLEESVEAPAIVDSSDYEAFLDDYSSHFAVDNREVLHGHVLSVSDKEVIVDIGRKIEGLVPASQFPAGGGQTRGQARRHH